MALTCLEQAYQLDPKNQKYKLDFYQSSLLLAQEAFSQIQEKEEKDSIIDDLLEIAQPLETCWKDGFDNVEKLKPLFQEVLVKIYVSLANVHIQRCLLPQPAKEMDKKEVKQHKEQHKDDIKQALNYFDKALSYQPENAALHFEKGLLLDWIIDFEQAIKELELAVKYQPRNPFYHKILGPLYFAVYSDSAKNEDHQALAEEYASPEFIGDYKIWEEEFMCQVQTRQIDPHAYTKKKGWFS